VGAKTGHSLKFSRWACRLTVLALIQPRVVPWDAPWWIYLHTLTFKDPEPGYAEARQRWRSLQEQLSRENKFGVCVPEFGKKTGRLHFHLVSTEWWDAKDMWRITEAYGFGRYNVRRRPCWRKPPNSTYAGKIHEAAWYLAKYVGKRHSWPEELKGCRQWSVFGAKHFPSPPVGVRDVRITEKTCYVIKESPRPFRDFTVWHWVLHNLSYWKANRPDAVDRDSYNMREITIDQQKVVTKLISQGDVVGVGEYRVGVIEIKQMESYKNGRPTGIKVDRAIVTHRIDFGAACERREFDELLPEGTDVKTVAFPAKSGELVAVCVDGMRAFQGGTNYKGRVINLSTPAK